MPKFPKSAIAVSIGISALVLVTVLVTFTTISQPDSDDWDATARLLIERNFDGPLPEPVPGNTNPRRSALQVALLITALLSFVYAYRRRRYVGEWIGAWLLISFGTYLISRGYSGLGSAQIAIGVLELGKIGTALLIYRSAHSFLGTIPYSRYDWTLMPGLVVWLALSGGRLDVPIVLAPGYLISGIIYTRAGLLFALSSRHNRMLGALSLGVGVLIVGMMNLGFGIFFESVMTSGRLVLLFLSANGLFFLVSAFGMHLLVFEEMSQELKATNRDLEEAQTELQELATLDPLTGCHNRRFLEQNIDRELGRHRRYRTPLSLLFLDIDEFKKVNDSFGHDVGDEVLRHVGEFLRKSVREADYVVRWGGDEFLVLIGCDGSEAADKVMALNQRFDEVVGSTVLPPGLSLSIGCAEIPADATEILSSIRIADQNMYVDKASRRS